MIQEQGMLASLIPHGSFGSLLHALTFGIFGGQKDRLNRHVELDYQVKP